MNKSLFVFTLCVLGFIPGVSQAHTSDDTPSNAHQGMAKSLRAALISPIQGVFSVGNTTNSGTSPWSTTQTQKMGGVYTNGFVSPSGQMTTSPYSSMPSPSGGMH